ncbi:MAG: tetratricopeptide repeat protein [Chloroflexi bacterium]|nr:tetratricopeptide repeat protein [Chloroflexota bacterium]
MNRRRRRVNWFWVTILIMLIAVGVYLDRVVVPTIPPPFVPTATPTRDPESFVTEAETLFEQGKLLASIDTYKQAIRARPDDPTTYVALARVQVFAGKYEDAQISAEDALLLNPNNSMAHAVRAWALDFQGDYLAAESAIKRALELDPNNAMAHAYYAEILADSFLSGSGPFDSIDLAAEESRVALSLAPNTLEAHRARGYILEVTGNYEDAIREYQASININENIPDLHLALGRNYRALGVYDKAVEEFTRANALNPADPLPDLFISRTYSTVGEYAKAVQYGEQALKDDPTSANLHGNLGVMYYHNFQWPEAAQELALAIYGGTLGEDQTIEPLTLNNSTRVAEYYFTYALVLARLNRCGEALQVSQTILGTIPGNELAVFNANEAISLCEQNLSVTPTSTLAPPPTETVTPAP